MTSKTEEIARAIFNEARLNNPMAVETMANTYDDLCTYYGENGIISDPKKTMLQLAEILEECLVQFPQAGEDDLIETIAGALHDAYNPTDENYFRNQLLQSQNMLFDGRKDKMFAPWEYAPVDLKKFYKNMAIAGLKAYREHNHLPSVKSGAIYAVDKTGY